MEMSIPIKHNIGDKVNIKELMQTGIVDEISYSVKGVMYRVCYWNNGSRHKTYMYSMEITAKEQR
jgi:hypothetical protein